MGKTVLITGASSGIGLAFARLFAQRGYNRHDEQINCSPIKIYTKIFSYKDWNVSNEKRINNSKVKTIKLRLQLFLPRLLHRSYGVLSPNL